MKKIDYKGFIEKYFTITTIDGEIVPMKLNNIQDYYYQILLKDYGGEFAPIRENILKSRRFGFSSLIDAMFCVDFILGEMGLTNISNSSVYSFRQKDTEELFKRVNQFINSYLLVTQGKDYRNPADREAIPELRSAFLKKDVGGTIIEGKNGSVYDCLTAGAKVAGRGGTRQNIHWSEVAFYNNTETLNARELVVGAEKQVSDGIGKIFRETTGNVSDNFFAEEYQAGKDGLSQFKSRFLPWYQFSEYKAKAPDDWQMPEYYAQIPCITRDQAYWHFTKTNGLQSKLEMREFPTTDTEAFLLGGDPYFSNDALVKYTAEIKEPIKEAEYVTAL
ncbi:hypothetical protein IJI55_00895 [Candidatus Saccharibacteria bacterium]|nr:hypothetical protein [Candidatus Saccharibacteria bacterium]